MRVIGTWHFEELPLEGAFGLDGTLTGGELVDEGFQGKALSFANAEPGTGVTVRVEKDPSWDVSNGFEVACAIRLEAARAGLLLNLGGAFGLSVTAGGAVRAQFRNLVTDEKTKEERAGGEVQVESQNGALRVGRWAYVEVEYDRRAFRLSIDGEEVARVEETAPVWRLEGPLRLSGERRPFPGSVDSLVVRAVSAEDVLLLPEDVLFAADAPAEIVFDAGGRLARSVHEKPVEVGLELGDGRTAVVRVNVYGSVE
jgi:hypothetical protein